MSHAPQFTFCLCPDSALLRLSVSSLLSSYAPKQGGEWQLHTFWGDEGLPPSFWEHLTLQGLFATPKALVLRHAEAIPAETLKELSRVLLQAADHVWPVLCLEVNFERGAPKVPAHIQKLPCYIKAQEEKWIQTIPGLDARTFPAFLQKEAHRHGLTLTPQETSILAANLPEDASLASSELAKLALAADANGNLPKDFAALLSASPELSLFELMKAIQSGGHKAPEAWKTILHNQTGGDTSVFAVIALLLREARILWQCLTGEAASLPSFMVQGKQAVAKQLGFPGIAKLWEMALMADKSVKTGERSPEQALEALVADVFLLFGGKNR